MGFTVKLQACERLILFLERISFNQLILRVHTGQMTVTRLEQLLVKSVRDEYDYNLSQQLYVSSATWDKIRHARENTLRMIHATASRLSPEAAATELANQLVKEVISSGKSPVQDAIEVCGTPYTVDTGSGVGKVVQDCVYQVYDQYCSYTVQEWRVVDTVSESGNIGQDPSWPEISLAAGRREGSSRQETYTIVFLSDGEVYTYQTGSYDLFRQAEPGDEWSLEINGLGQIVSAQP